MAKYLNKYHSESHRLQSWNYGDDAFYFVTVCTKNREHFFGEVIDGKMKLSPIGHIANSCWHEIGKHFSYIKLHNHVIMPDHMHGLLEFAKDEDHSLKQTPNLGVSSSAKLEESTKTADKKPRTYNASQKWKPKTLGVIINQYKRACTINSRKINPNFAWQSNYHDHVIRDKRAYQNIFNYITNNPKKWTEDRLKSE